MSWGFDSGQFNASFSLPCCNCGVSNKTAKKARQHPPVARVCWEGSDQEM